MNMMLIKVYGCYFVFSLFMLAYLRRRAAKGIENKNYYTINQYNYNKLFFLNYASFTGAICFLLWSQANFGCYIRNRCLKLTVLFICILFRICLLAVWLNCFHLLYVFLKDTMYLNQKNWWQDEVNEKFFTNDDWVNCFVCWVLWLQA